MDERYSEVISFSDETSLPRTDETVPILAQVIQQNSLEWFFTLVRQAQNCKIEVKSTVAAELFFTLAADQQRKAWTTLRSVRIHITDPRLYASNVDTYIEQLLPSLNAKHHNHIRLLRNKWIAEDMLEDSPSRQIPRNLLAIAHSHGIIDDRTEQRLVAHLRRPFDLRPFRRNSRSLVGVLASHLSKSHPVLFDALEVTEIGRGMPSLSLGRAEFQLSKVLAQSHAFDKGNSQAVDWIKGQRQEVLNAIDPHQLFRLKCGFSSKTITVLL